MRCRPRTRTALLRALSTTPTPPHSHSQSVSSSTEATVWEKSMVRGAKGFPEFIEWWDKKAFYAVGAASTLGVGAYASAAMAATGSVGAMPVVAGVVVGLYWFQGMKDMRQERHAVLRNFPVLGNVRYIFEVIRPEIRQYFIESDSDGAPFSREQRSKVYQRAKAMPDALPFGTRKDTYGVGYEYICHSLFPKDCHYKASYSDEMWVETNEEHTGTRVLVGKNNAEHGTTQPYSCSIFNISAMSFGALSPNAVLALNAGAKRGGFFHNTGEGGVSRYHKAPGGDLVWNVGTGYFGCRDTETGGFCAETFKDTVVETPAIKMIEIKLSQGAKPGHGGILPAAKITPVIAEARGLKGEDLLRDVNSPPNHKAFDTVEGLLDFVSELRELSGGKPVGFKLCVGRPIEILNLVDAMARTNLAPDFITVDGGEGGTGAAPPEFSDSVGVPLDEALTLVNSMLIGAGMRDRVTLIASGKVHDSMSLFRTLALGADACNSARGMMFALGCIQALKCHTNTCPTGITTQKPELMNGLVVHDKAQRVANFHAETLKTACELAGAAGLRSLSDIMPEHVMRRTSRQVVESFADLYPRMESGSLFKASEKDGGKSFAQILDENCDSFVTLEEFNSFARQHRDEASGHLTRDYRDDGIQAWVLSRLRAPPAPPHHTQHTREMRRTITVGQRVRHVRTRQEGVARFVGDVEEAHGLAKNMVAVEYDDPVPETDTMADMHDGSYRGVSYFNGKHGHVLFSKKFLIEPLDESVEEAALSPRSIARSKRNAQSVSHYHLSEQSESDSIRRLAGHAFRAFDADNSGEIDCDEVASLRLESDVSTNDDWAWSDVLRAAGADPTTNILTRERWMDYIVEKYAQCTTELQKRWLRDELMQYVDARDDMQDGHGAADAQLTTFAWEGAAGGGTVSEAELTVLLSPSPVRVAQNRFLGRAGLLAFDEIASLSAEEVEVWLGEHRLGCLAPAFRDARIDGARLVTLTLPEVAAFGAGRAWQQSKLLKIVRQASRRRHNSAAVRDGGAAAAAATRQLLGGAVSSRTLGGAVATTLPPAMLKQMSEMQRLMKAQEEKIANLESEGNAKVAPGFSEDELAARLASERNGVKSEMKAQMEAMQARFAAMMEQKEAQLAQLQAAAEKEKKLAEDPEGKISLMRIDDQLEVRKDCLRNEVEQLYSLSRDVRSQIVDMNGALRVVTRCRPMLSRDEGAIVVACKRDVLYLGKDRLKDPPQGFRFHSVLGPNSSQVDLFNSVKDIALSVLDMNNVCLFAYGSTGSGKTFSMQGPPSVLTGTATPEENGLYPRILDAMFERITHLTEREVGEYELYMRIADNYLKDVNDLLEDDPAKRDKTNAIQHGDPFESFISVPIRSREEFMVQLEKFSSRRVTAMATHNASSRSHMVMSLLVKETIEEREAQIVLVDLAGSEKFESVMEHVKKANAKTQMRRKKECQEINTSLMCLGTVMRGLGQKQAADDAYEMSQQRLRDGIAGKTSSAGTTGSKHRSRPSSDIIPFRNSKLTLLLKNTLLGHGTNHPKIVMLCCVPPNSALEGCTRRALNFAVKCGNISIGVSAETRVANQAKVAALQIVDTRVTALIEMVEALVAEAEPDAPTYSRKLKQRKGKQAWCGKAKAMQARTVALRRELEAGEV